MVWEEEALYRTPGYFIPVAPDTPIHDTLILHSLHPKDQAILPPLLLMA